jgi:hypothetical protein
VTPILETLASHGIMGILCVILMLVIRDRQSKLEAEHEARLKDKDEATRALLALSDKVHAALDKMSEVLELVRHQPAAPQFPVNPTSGQR